MGMEGVMCLDLQQLEQLVHPCLAHLSIHVVDVLWHLVGCCILSMMVNQVQRMDHFEK